MNPQTFHSLFPLASAILPPVRQPRQLGLLAGTWVRLVFLVVALLGGSARGQQSVTNVIAIQSYDETWDYFVSGGTGRACGYYLYGRFPAFLEYTNIQDYVVEGLNRSGRSFVPDWTVSRPNPGEDFVFGVGGSWGTGPAAGSPCPTLPPSPPPTGWTATLIVPPPDVSFGYYESSVVPGRVKFTSFSTDPKRKKLEFLWNFGDGKQDTFTAPSHDYEKPGEYEVTLRATNPAGAFDTRTNMVTIKPPQLSVSLAFVDRQDSRPTLGEVVQLRAIVRASRSGLGALSGVQFVESPVLGIPEVFEVIEAPANTTIGDLQPGESRTNVWTLKAVNAGQFVLRTAAVRGIDTAGRPVDADGGSLPGSVSGLNVEVTFLKKPLQLKKKPAQPGELSNNPGYEPGFIPVRVKVSVPKGGKPVQDLTLMGWDQSDGGLDIDKVRSTGIPEQPFALAVPQPVPFPLTVREKPPGATVRPVLTDQDAPREFDFLVEAERPGTFTFAALFTAKQVGANTVLQERGSNIQPVLGELVLAVQLEVVNEPAQIKEGESVEVFGRVKNLTDDETILLDPIRVVSSGQGAVFGPIEQAATNYPPLGSLSVFAPILTPDGDTKEARFRVRVQTSRLPGLDQRWLVSRQSVALDFAVGGEVVGGDGLKREIEQENIAVEWGNGAFPAENPSYLRVPVAPDLLRPRELGWGEFALDLYGNSMAGLGVGVTEGVETGLYNAYLFFSSLDTVVWNIKSFAESAAAEQSETFMRHHRYKAKMEHWMISTYTGISPETRKAEVDAISAEITAYYGRKARSGEQIRAWVDNGITSYFAQVLDAKNRAFEHDYEFNEETAKVMTSWVKPTSKAVTAFVTEEAVTDLATGMILSRIARSRRVAADVAETAQKQAAKDAVDVEAAAEAIARRGEAGHPGLVEAPADLRNLRGGAVMNQSQAIRAYAVDRVTDDNLIRYTRNMPVIIAIRSRADETLEWMRTQLGMTPKPVTIKPKNVDLIDEEFLEYRKGVGYGDALGRGAGDRGSVVLAEPIPPDVLAPKLVGLDEELRQQVVERYRTRWEEWYGDGSLPTDKTALPFDTTMRPGSMLEELKRLTKQDVIVGDNVTARTTRRGRIEVPKRGSVTDASINTDVNWKSRAEAMEPRLLELRQAINPPGNDVFQDRLKRDREYYEVWLESEPVGNAARGTYRGTLRRVSGDVDVVLAADVSGYKFGLAPRLRDLAINRDIWAYGNQVARTLQHIMKAQHPWSSSLGLVLPNLTLSRKIEKMRAKYLAAHVWNIDLRKRGEPLLCYVNGERRIAWFDPSKNIDPDNPLAAMLFLDGGPISVDDVVRSQWEGRNLLPRPENVVPTVVRTSATAIRASLIDNDYINQSSLLATCTIATARTSGAALYRLGQSEQLEKRNPDGKWSTTLPESECGPEGIIVVPETVISENVAAGAKRLPILEELLGPNWRELFRIGDDILIAPGTPEEELNTIANHGSLILARPLRFNHPAGTRVALLPPTPAAAIAATGRPLIWLKADAGVELRGTNVLTWTDQAGGLRFVNPEGGRDGLPALVNSDLGMPAIQFRGDEWISGGIARQLTNATIFTLGRFNVASSSGSDYLYSLGAAGTSGSMMTLARRNGDNAYHYDGRTVNAPDTSLPAGVWQVFTQVYGEGDPASQQLFQNGTRILNTRAANPYRVDAARMFVGNYFEGNNFFIGDIIEWVVFDRVLPPAERAEVQLYLQKRGGLFRPASVPVQLTLAIRPSPAGPDRWILSWEGEAGRQYYLDWSTTLEPESWITEHTITPQSSGTAEVEILSPPEEVTGFFYRLRSN